MIPPSGPARGGPRARAGKRMSYGRDDVDVRSGRQPLPGSLLYFDPESLVDEFLRKDMHLRLWPDVRHLGGGTVTRALDDSGAGYTARMTRTRDDAIFRRAARTVGVPGVDVRWRWTQLERAVVGCYGVECQVEGFRASFGHPEVRRTFVRRLGLWRAKEMVETYFPGDVDGVRGMWKAAAP